MPLPLDSVSLPNPFPVIQADTGHLSLLLSNLILLWQAAVPARYMAS